MFIRIIITLLLTVLTAAYASAEEIPDPLKKRSATIDARIKALNRSARDDGDYALKLYKYKRTLAKDAAFESNATVAEYLHQRLDDISDEIRRTAERKKSIRAMYVHAHDLYSRGQTAETSPALDGADSERLYGEAAKWLKMSSAHPPSNVLLGHLFQEGKGVPRSRHAAIDHYFTAGRQFLNSGETDRALAMLDLIESADPTHPQGARLYTMIRTSGKTTPAKRSGGMGTGFVCGRGWVATAWHVVRDAKKITVRQEGGKTVTARLAAMDKDADLALLEADFTAPVPALPSAKSAPGLGAEVFTLGFPNPALMGASPRVTGGRISATSGLNDDPRTYQISVPVQPGNSGGPLLNMRGEVVGVVASTLSAAKMFRWTGAMPQNVNFAVKSNQLDALLGLMNRKPAVRSPKLPGNAAGLEALVERIRPSVVLVIAK